MTSNSYSPLPDNNPYYMFAVRVHPRKKTPGADTQKYFPVAALDRAMAARIIREKYPHMLVVNVSNS